MNGWKVTAIIFIILFIVETMFVYWAWTLGTDMIEQENTCSKNICSNYESFIYDEYGETCYCYVGDELVYQEFLG